MIDSRFLHVTYCDDIREEVRNKYSLVGCYSTDLVLKKIPATLPKLCLHAVVVTPVARPFERLTLRILLNDESLGELELAQLDKALQSSGGIPPDATRLTAAANITLSPFAVSESGVLRVEAITEAETLIGDRLYIRTAQIASPDA